MTKLLKKKIKNNNNNYSKIIRRIFYNKQKINPNKLKIIFPLIKTMKKKR